MGTLQIKLDSWWRKKEKKKEEKNKTGPTPGTPRNIQPGYHKDKIYFIPRRNTRCLTNPFLQTRKQCGTRTETKIKRTEGNKYLPLNIREMIGFRSRTSQSTVNNGTPSQNFDSTQPYIT